MQQEQPQFYASLAGHLSAEEQGVIQSVVAKADELAAQEAQIAQMASMAGQAAPDQQQFANAPQS